MTMKRGREEEETEPGRTTTRGKFEAAVPAEWRTGDPAMEEGIAKARDETLEFLEDFKWSFVKDGVLQTVACEMVAGPIFQRLSADIDLLDHLSAAVANAVQCIYKSDQPIDLSMVDLVSVCRSDFGIHTSVVGGLILDHGLPLSDPKRAENCYILTCDMSLELEDEESGQREKLVATGRRQVDERVKKIIELKNKVCAGSEKGFVVINKKGIDPPSLDLLAKAGIVALRGEKRCSTERLVMACGGTAVNSVEDLTDACLGWAGSVYEKEMRTFVENVKNPYCTVLIEGPDAATIRSFAVAFRDALKSVKHAISDGAIVLGAGAFEAAAWCNLAFGVRYNVVGGARLGVEAFAEGLLAILRSLAENSERDPQEALDDLMFEHVNLLFMGLDKQTGKIIDPRTRWAYDGYQKKIEMISSMQPSWPVMTSHFLL